MANSFHIGMRMKMATVLLAAAAICGAQVTVAQVMQAPGTLPNGRRIPVPPQFFNGGQQAPPQAMPPQQPMQPSAAPAASQPAPAASGAQAPSLLDKPPQPARVTLSSGDLSVKADNSSLTQILHDLSSSTGMTVDGLSKDQRVFGVYGPANPRDVLSELLQDSGYNVMMVGMTANGAPRQLLLTPRSGPALSSSPQSQPMQNRDNDADDEAPAPADPDVPPPGAVPSPHLPEQNQPATPGAVRTPQQMLQELEQLRQQQLQQQPQQPQ